MGIFTRSPYPESCSRFLLSSWGRYFLGVIANATEIMLNKRENKTRLEKLNMLIGVFFSGVGTRLWQTFQDLILNWKPYERT